ncbi:uncharacterized protein LOC122382846 [Amphibalanus amphitrite]|uniref:uncharacterized protein LOC122382846 n=1 Tax=Amphibalanus amphitrite TaxID=1232801 RepID=UPI001C91567F|nr:uncharacterized protein LOC122382846 [Amphibalanus amphitrite]
MIGRLARVLCRSVSSIRTVGSIAALTLVAAGGAALCPTPDTWPLSSAVLLSPGISSQLPWAEAPQGTVARYRCDPGYLPVGLTERTCRADGTWSGAAPRCLLNIASQTSLRRWPALVDDSLETHIELSQLNQLYSEDIKLYTVPSLGAEHQSRTLPSIREIRFITTGEHDLDGLKIFVTKPKLSDPCDGTDRFPAPTEISRGSSVKSGTLTVHTFLTKSCFKKILIKKSNAIKKTDSSLPAAAVLEVQLLTEQSGVSSQQCRLPPSPVVSDDDPAISWAAGPLCYHLFSDRLSRAAAATLCRQLGPSGQLVRLHSSGVHNIAQLVLRQSCLANRWANEFIWTAGEDQDDEQTRNAEDGSSPPPSGKEYCIGIKQIKRWGFAPEPCEEKWMFICQTAPSMCGSPAVGSGQRYDPPPSPHLLAANVTCAGYSTAEGAVFCREGRWTPADFCPTDGLLGTALGAVAGVMLLLGCVLLAAASYMKHKRDNESGWEAYTYIRRLSRLSRYGGRRHELAANLVTDNAYSAPMTAAGSKSPVSTSGGSPRASWLYGQPAARRGNAELLPPPPPSSSPVSSAGLVNPHYRAPSASDQPPPTAVSPANLAVEYSVPLVQGQRQSPKLSFAGRPEDGAVGDEYAVPYDARGQVSERTGAPPDVVTSTGGM